MLFNAILFRKFSGNGYLLRLPQETTNPNVRIIIICKIVLTKLLNFSDKVSLRYFCAFVTDGHMKIRHFPILFHKFVENATSNLLKKKTSKENLSFSFLYYIVNNRKL